MLTIEDIKNVSFRKSGIGGYKPEDVDSFIDQVLITFEQLRKEKSDLIKKMDILARRVEEYRADEDSVRNAMLSAQRVADSTIREARAKAARILEESENIAKAKLYDLNIQIKQQKKQYTLLLAECNRLRDDIISHCNKHIAIAKELPSVQRIQAMEESIEERYPTDNSSDYERADEVAAANAESKAPAAEVKEETAPATEPAKGESASAIQVDDLFDISIVSDIDTDDTAPAAEPADKKKGRDFSGLKFGDNYDVESDDDNGNADSE
ncbi:MAG: DivIVA domain-containing protein [Ruminococcaceae bacterium]|nr:DivIVA domain-containing protein [Oscillospiraceae bacterium]